MIRLLRRIRSGRRRRKMGKIERAWRWMWQFRLTAAGKIMLGGIMFAGMTCWVTFAIPVYHVFCSLVAAYLASSLFVFLHRPRLRVSATSPNRAVAGQVVPVRFRITNISKRRSALDVGVGLFQLPDAVEEADRHPMLPRLGVGQSAELILPATKEAPTTAPVSKVDAA